MFKTLTYKHTFRYQLEDPLQWFQNFELSETWSYIEIQTNRHISLSYHNKIPFIKPPKINNKYIAIYAKEKWCILNLDENYGYYVTSSDSLKVPNLSTYNITSTPYTQYFTFDFDYHIMMATIRSTKNIHIVNLSLTHSTIKYENIKIRVFENILIYTGHEQSIFEQICITLKNEYETHDSNLTVLFKALEKQEPHPASEHISIAPNTWYNAKRENQKEWPKISKTHVPNSLEFPKNSDIYYYHEKSHVELCKRHDDNSEIYIPKLFKRNYSKLPTSITYHYIHNIPYTETTNKTPLLIKQAFRGKITKIKQETCSHTECLEVDYKGLPIYTTSNSPKVICYQNQILFKIKKLNFEIDIPDNAHAQIIDKHYTRTATLINDVWNYSKKGVPIRNCISLPSNYADIIHDYNKLNRLDEGPYMDLMHIGIINEKSTDRITFPCKKENLYISKILITKYSLNTKLLPHVKMNVITT